MSDESFKPMRLPAWIDYAASLPAPKWLIKDIIPADGLTIISGRPKKSKKSWFAYLASLSMASGRTLGAFQPGAPGGVPLLYLNHEGSVKFTAERFPMLAKGHGLDLGACEKFHMAHNTPCYLDEPRSLAQLCHYVKDNGIEVVVLDTFARSFLGDENSARDVNKAMQGVGKLRALGASVVLVHHNRKTYGKDSGDIFDVSMMMRGSSSLDGAMDQLIGIVSVPNEEQPGHFDNWISLGGKHAETTWYEQIWTIVEGDSAHLEMDGPKDVPSPEPQQRPRF